MIFTAGVQSRYFPFSAFSVSSAVNFLTNYWLLLAERVGQCLGVVAQHADVGAFGCACGAQGV